MAGERDVHLAALMACLALVRPVGMTEAETEDWLRVAVDTLAHIPPHILERGARSARTTCTHHAQIVPAIVAATREDMAWHGRPRARPVLALVGTPAPAADQPLPDPETLPLPLRRMGLQRGWFIERDGRLQWAPALNEGSAA